MHWYLFAKFFRHLPLEDLMDCCASLGLCPTALIRAGYWIEEPTLAQTLPAFVRAAEARGFNVQWADSSYGLDALSADPTPLAVLADNGIRAVRVGYVKREAFAARELPAAVRRMAEQVCVQAQRHNIRAVMHLHMECYPHNATAAYPLVCGLDPAHIGVMLDPGNNRTDGQEEFRYQVDLLSEYVAGAGVKDVRYDRLPAGQDDAKGWRSSWVPCQAGVTDWRRFFAAVRTLGREIPCVLMPFYHSNDFPRLHEALVQEVAYLRARMP